MEYGTIMHRVDATVLRFVPGFIKDPLKKIVGKVIGMGRQGLNATAGQAQRHPHQPVR